MELVIILGIYAIIGAATWQLLWNKTSHTLKQEFKDTMFALHMAYMILAVLWPLTWVYAVVSSFK